MSEIELTLVCDNSNGVYIQWNVSEYAICESTANYDEAVINIYGICVHKHDIVKVSAYNVVIGMK